MTTRQRIEHKDDVKVIVNTTVDADDVDITANNSTNLGLIVINNNGITRLNINSVGNDKLLKIDVAWFKIFSYLTFCDIHRCRYVSKYFKTIFDSPNHWKIRASTFPVHLYKFEGDVDFQKQTLGDNFKEVLLERLIVKIKRINDRASYMSTLSDLAIPCQAIEDLKNPPVTRLDDLKFSDDVKDDDKSSNDKNVEIPSDDKKNEVKLFCKYYGLITSDFKCSKHSNAPIYRDAKSKLDCIYGYVKPRVVSKSDIAKILAILSELNQLRPHGPLTFPEWHKRLHQILQGKFIDETAMGTLLKNGINLVQQEMPGACWTEKALKERLYNILVHYAVRPCYDGGDCFSLHTERLCWSSIILSTGYNLDSKTNFNEKVDKMALVHQSMGDKIAGKFKNGFRLLRYFDEIACDFWNEHEKFNSETGPTRCID